MFTVLFAIAFSLAVCAVIGVGVTAILDRAMAFAQEQRKRISINR